MTPAGCSSWLWSEWPRPPAQCNWSTPEMAARGPRPMSLMKPCCRPLKPLAQTSNAKRASAKPPSAPLARLARLDHCPSRRMELLLQTSRTQNHARRMGPVRCHGSGLPHRHFADKCVNPVGCEDRWVRSGRRVAGVSEHSAPNSIRDPGGPPSAAPPPRR